MFIHIARTVVNESIMTSDFNLKQDFKTVNQHLFFYIFELKSFGSLNLQHFVCLNQYCKYHAGKPKLPGGLPPDSMLIYSLTVYATTLL